MDFWDKVKKDLQKGFNEGIAVMKEGVGVVKTKAEELTAEGKRQYKIYQLKTKVQNHIAELGGKVYSLSSTAGNPLLDNRVKGLVARIKTLEEQIDILEGKKTTAKAKKPAAAKKPRTARPAAAKKGPVKPRLEKKGA